MMTRVCIFVLGTLAVGGGVPAAVAHHSFAAFDRDTSVILTGKVKEFQWTNPHAWIQLLVTDGEGAETEWSIECGSPNMMARHGWKSRTLQSGDKIALVMHPMTNGESAGSLVSVTLADGQVLGPGGVPAPKTGNAPPPR
jgi:hypothetical protein